MKLKRLLAKENYGTIFLFILLLAAFTLVATLNLTKLPYALHSDLFGETLYARDMWEQKTFFPKHWVHPHESLAFRPSMITALYYGLTNNLLLSQSLMTITVTLLVLAAFAFLLSGFSVKMNSILLGELFLLVGFSYQFTHVVFLYHCYYDFIYINHFFTIGVLIRIVHNTGKRQRLWFGLSCIMAIISGLRGYRMIVFLYAPVLLTAGALWIYHWIVREKQRFDQRLIGATVILFVCNLSGAVGYTLLFSSNVKEPVTDTMLAPVSDLLDRAAGIFEQLLNFVGASGDTSLFSLSGINYLTKLIAVAGISFAICLLYKFVSETSRITLLLVWGNALMVALMLTIILSYYNLYIYPLLFALVLSAVVAIDTLWVIRPMLAVSCTVSLCLAIVINVVAIYIPMLKPQADLPQKAVADFLEENEIDFAYASFWNARVLTGLSNGKIETGHIDLDSGEPWHWFVNLDVYSVKDYDESAVLVLDKNEEAELLKDSANYFHQYTSRVIFENTNFSVYQFDVNPFALDKLSPAHMIFPADSDALKINGEDAEKAADGIVLFTNGLAYGPYITLSPGDYEVTIYGSGLQFANYDCTWDAGQGQFQLKNESVSDKQIIFQINVPEKRENVECHVLNHSATPVKYTQLEFHRLEKAS